MPPVSAGGLLLVYAAGFFTLFIAKSVIAACVVSLLKNSAMMSDFFL